MPEEIEPEYSQNDYRACAIYFLRIFQPALSHAIRAKNVEVGYCQIMFALGLESEPMSHAAARLNVERACISKGAKEFIRANNLPTPAGMRSEKASKSYRKSRNSKLQ